MTEITEQKTILTDVVKGQCGEAIAAHAENLLAKLMKEGRLSFSIPVKISPTRDGKYQVEATMTYIEKKVTDTFVGVVDFRQLPLPGMETKGYKLNKAGAK